MMHFKSSSRKTNTIRNFSFSLGSYIINALLSFATRTVFIRLLASEYLGLNGLFSNVLSIISLAELGAGGAFVSLLYKPIADNDTKRLASIMAAFKKAYICIGCAVGIIGICFIPFLDFFTPGSDIPNRTLIYLLFLGNSVVTYFCADKNALITADQKSYLVTTYSQVSVIIQYALQIIILLLTHNYILYLTIQILCGVGLNIYTANRAKRIYPLLREKAERLSPVLKKDVKEKIAGGFCVHAGYVVASGTDSLVISHFLGLGVLGVYSNYLLIINIVTKFSNMVMSAVHASACNFAVSSTSEVNYAFFRKLNFLNILMMGFLGTCLITMFNPFITIWAGNDYVLDQQLVILAVLLYLVGWHGTKLPISIYRDAFGLYYNDRHISLLEGFLNVVISILLVKPLGLTGVFLGTLISSISTTISGAFLVYHHVFHISSWSYWKTFFGYGGIIAVVGFLSYFITHLLPCATWPHLFLMAFLCAIITLSCYLAIFWHTEEMRFYLRLIKPFFNRSTCKNSNFSPLQLPGRGEIYKKHIKRPLDFALSLLALIIFSPIMLTIALLVRIKLGSPVIFRQDRPGLSEKIFTLYKFRTMTNEHNENGDLLPDVKRLTKFGRLLRSTSLDELPELWNILKGDMSIVGPRPLLTRYLHCYSETERKRHDVRPGLTGLAQINGRNILEWDTRLLFDVEYVNGITFLGDLKIVLRTMLKVIRREGITFEEGCLDIERSEKVLK